MLKRQFRKHGCVFASDAFGIAISGCRPRASGTNIVRAGNKLYIAAVGKDPGMNPCQVLDKGIAVSEPAKTQQAQQMMTAQSDCLHHSVGINS